MGVSSGANIQATRVERLRSELDRLNLPLLVVSSLPNIHYLTGFQGSAGLAVYGHTEARLWVDPRYILQARCDAPGVEVIEEKGSLLKAVAKWVEGRHSDRVGYEDSSLTAKDFCALQSPGKSATRWVPASGVIEDLRQVKDSDEIARLREAGRVTVEAFEEVINQLRPGIKENDLAAEIEYRMRLKGAEGAAFDTIIASGFRGAWPHARPTAKLLQNRELIIFDLGAKLRGYCADMTRTFYLGRPDRRVNRLYHAVLEAQREALEALRPGVRASRVDAAARRALGRSKLAKFFTHSTGHGVGLEIHEKPRLGKGDKTRIQSGNAITVEPGVYLEGFGGIRIEDTVLVTDSGQEILTPATRETWFAD